MCCPARYSCHASAVPGLPAPFPIPLAIRLARDFPKCNNSALPHCFTLLVQICNALDVTIDYLLENEYHAPTSALEKELLNTVKDMPNEKRETLLRIAKVL